MAFEPGARFGSYEVAESIGSGGMGEVWRANDTSLKRDVALKVLPQAFVQEADRLARFQREAEILASLNHPNIAQVYGIEKTEGQTAIVMELVEGPTLADRIKEGPIPPDEAMGIAMQVVSALEAAHDKQIVHRDLKPANVKVKADGTVKVLDFGISKPIDASAISGGSRVTTTPAMTQTGVILGTAAYMSPEQARGRFVDERTDIWAFGCLLFEMLTGQPAFGGEDVMLTLARVLDRDTDLSSIPKTLSPAVRHTIKLCLEKDPRNRIADIRDVRLALEGTFESGLPRTPTELPVRISPWRRVLPLSAAVVIGGIVVGLAAWSRWPSPEPPLQTRFEQERTEEQVFRNLGRDVIALSPDSRFLAFNTTQGLYLRVMDTIGARVLAGTEMNLTNPFFSPDGQWIGYWNVVAGQLQKIRISGGSPVPLTSSLNPNGATWTSDDMIVYGQPEGILAVSANGGTPETLIGSDGRAQYWNPQVLPDGSILFTVLTGNSGLIAIETPGRDDRTELFPGERAVYLPTGHLVTTDLQSIGTLFVRTFDLSTRTYGGPVPLEENVWASNAKHHFAISQTGTLAYATGSPAVPDDNTLAIVDSDGIVSPLGIEPALFRGPRVSPDGTRLAVEIIGENERSSIWVYDLTGGRGRRPLLGAGSNVRPLWTPDGERLTFASDRDGTWGIYWQAADGSGVAERLTIAEKGVEHWPDSWTSDMRTLAFTRIEGTLGSIVTQGIWTVDMDEDGTPGDPAPFIEDEAGGASFSPNGRWIAYRSTDPELDQAGGEVNVQPFPPTGEIHAVTDRGGSYPIWSRAGDELLYRRPSGGSAVVLTFGRVEVTSEESFAWGSETEIRVPSGVANFGYRGFDLLPDGRIVAVVGTGSSDIATERQPIEIATNWFELVKDRVPTQ